MADSPWTLVAAIAAVQHGLVHFDQLVAADVPTTTLIRWRQQGRLERLQPRLYRIAGAPPTWLQSVMAACLSTGGAASHRTAAALRRLDGFPRGGIIEVIVPRGARVRRTAAIVHQSRDLVDTDITVVEGIPCTTLVRTLVDLPALCSEAHTGKALDSAVRRHRSEEVLRGVLVRHLQVARRGRAGTRKLRRLLARRFGEDLPTDSTFEDEFLDVCRTYDIPMPQTQFCVVLPDGSKVHLDSAWPESKVYVECDSLEHHFGELAFEKDRKRRRALVALGWRPYEYTYWEVRLAKSEVAAQIRRALGLT